MNRTAKRRSSIAHLLTLLLALCCVPAQAQQPLVLRLTLHDTIQPITAAYIQRGLDEASKRHDRSAPGAHECCR